MILFKRKCTESHYFNIHSSYTNPIATFIPSAALEIGSQGLVLKNSFNLINSLVVITFL